MQIIPFSNLDIPAIADALEDGQTLVYPTETCYGLGCDATDQTAVDQVFDIKKRQKYKSVLMVVPDREMAQEYVVWNDDIERLANMYWPGPLTIVAEVLPGSELARGVMADDGTVAFRVSSHPLVYELAASLGRPLVSTSANVAEMDSPYDIESVIAMFEGQSVQPDIIIDAGELPEQSPSTIVRVHDGEVEVLRQGSIVIE